MIQRAWPVRQRPAFRANHFFQPGAGRDRVPGRRDDRDGVGRRPNFLAMRTGWIPVMILLTDT